MIESFSFKEGGGGGVCLAVVVVVVFFFFFVVTDYLSGVFIFQNQSWYIYCRVVGPNNEEEDTRVIREGKGREGKGREGSGGLISLLSCVVLCLYKCISIYRRC